MFKEIYDSISEGTDRWNALNVPQGILFDWDEKSTYIHKPPFFTGVTTELKPIEQVKDAYCLCVFGDLITTDHISPGGKV